MSSLQDNPQQIEVISEDYLGALKDNIQRKFPNTPDAIAIAVASSAPRAGHDDWLASSRGRNLPHPEKDKNITVSYLDKTEITYRGRSGYMKFNTIVEIRNILVSCADVYRDGFKKRVAQDLSIPLETLDYIDDLDNEVFRKWMYSIAFENINDNNSWAFASVELLEEKQMGLEIHNKDSKNKLIEDIKNLYLTTKALQNPSTRPETAGDYKRLFEQSFLLKDSMILAHGHWRERLTDLLKNKEVAPVDPIDAVATLKTIITADVKFISIDQVQSFVEDLRERVHLNPSNPTHEETFNLMINLADVLDTKLVRLDKDSEFSQKLTKVRNSLLGQLSYDANVAIPISIDSALGLKIDFNEL
jgi:hypothetical protein